MGRALLLSSKCWGCGRRCVFVSWSGHILRVVVMQGMKAEAVVKLPAIGGICAGIETPRARLYSRFSDGVSALCHDYDRLQCGRYN